MFGIQKQNRNIFIFPNKSGQMTSVSVVTSASQKSANKRAKRLNYNFKEISSQILKTKTSRSARLVVTKARNKVVALCRQQSTRETYDEELQHAIIHARKMERIARKRMKHLEEEEDVKKRGGVCLGGLEDGKDAIKNQEMSKELSKEFEELSKKTAQELSKEMQEQMAELMESMEELVEEVSGMDELNEAICGIMLKDMEPIELEALKKKHRSEELKEIAEADMKYLKAMFQKLEREKANTGGSVSGNGQDSSSGFSCNSVSMELSGIEIPVESIPEVFAMEGTNVDVTV